MEAIGKYKVLKQLGAGGFGAVYLAEAPITNAQVAIKIFQVKDENLVCVATSASQDASGVLKERFLSEARTLEQLSHNPYIVSIRDYDELDDGTPYYVMPYLPTSLEQEIGKDAFTRGKLEETPKALHPRKLASSRATEILKQILEGMREVHRAGLIHRDIKPANILFDAQGNVQICDFGIAKSPDAEHSQSGVGMGSRNYMSPEQRESAKHVSPASDVYSIGVLAYRMLTGQLPSHPYEPPIQFSPGIGQPLNDLIDIAIAQQETKRPADAGDFLRRFNQAVKASNEIEVEDEGTGTWVGGESEIKAELKPLQDKIEQVLLSEGDIPASERFAIEALAAVGNLDKAELDAFIAHIKERNKDKLQPLNNWLKLVRERASAEQGRFSEATKSALVSAGRAIGLSGSQIDQKLEKECQVFQTKDELTADIKKENKKADTQARTQTKSTSSKLPFIMGALLIVISLAGYGVWQNQQSQPARTSTKSSGQSSVASEYTLRVESTPSDAQVSVDGKRVSNKRISLSPGSYRLSVEKAGYNTVNKIVELRGDKTEYVSLSRSAPVRLPLTINTSPSDARVQILNIQPVYYEGIRLEPGDYQVKVSAEGYESETRWVSLNTTHSQFEFSLNKAKPRYTAGVQSVLDSMVSIPGGSFMMGSNDGESDEKPVHRVTIKSFKLMETEVTWAMYQPCIDDGVCPEAKDEGWGKANRPVINVSWNDITQKYIPWLNQKTGQTFRLPTEAEWEYAARAGTTTKYSWGNSIDCNKARYGFLLDECDIEGSAYPVKSFSPNAFGLYDMHGNVREWVQDCINDSYSGAPGDGSAWMSGNCDRAVHRGGSFFNTSDFLRSAGRGKANRSSRSFTVGFRLALGE
ncbi:SUMF1/EgtB/PvdO family nonheme iron enzyme [Planctobacterium marinum]|uniref:Protein kinase domain-containing protein n=1 Tax=Planctobacterium marinum TaxID=1631968 RepID=A0AA48KSE1_9ALTE|nr:hypothetical protein MACH26_19150 [Planctobacterium marinum]